MKFDIQIGIPKPELGGDREECQQTIMEMRKLISRAGYHSALIRQCQVIAEHEGLNGEEMMTLLAYHALRQLQDSWERECDRVMREPMPSIP